MNKAELDKAIANISEGIKILDTLKEQHMRFSDGELTRLQSDKIALACMKQVRARQELADADIVMNAETGRMIEVCPECLFIMEYTKRKPKYCVECGRRLEADDLQEYADTPEAWAKRRIEGEEQDDKT
jgi:hypothetical protein